MNLGAGLLGGYGSGAQALGLDYSRLIASLAAAQATSRTASLDLQNKEDEASSAVEALVTLFAAQPGWASGVANLGGSFNPAVARRLAETGRRGR